MHATTLDALDWNAGGWDAVECDSDDAGFGQPKREKFRQSLGKVYRARAAERRTGRVKCGHGHRRAKRMTW